MTDLLMLIRSFCCCYFTSIKKKRRDIKKMAEDLGRLKRGYKQTWKDIKNVHGRRVGK